MADVAESYRETQSGLALLARELPEQGLATLVPASPAWTVKDVVAHVTGLAVDVATGELPPDVDPVASLSDPEKASRRDELTATQVEIRRDRSIHQVIEEWEGAMPDLLAIMRGERPSPQERPFLDVILLTDLAVHAQDVRNAVGREGDRDSAGVRIALASYAAALTLRLAQRGLAPLRLRYEGKERVVGDGEPGATLSGDRYEIFRALAGRRTVEQMHAMDWEGDPGPYVEVLPAYDPPAEPLPEA